MSHSSLDDLQPTKVAFNEAFGSGFMVALPGLPVGRAYLAVLLHKLNAAERFRPHCENGLSNLCGGTTKVRVPVD